MSEAKMFVRLRVATAGFDAALASVGEAMRAAEPAVRDFTAAVKFMYDNWPGMPYTKPSLWDASQMAADR